MSDLFWLAKVQIERLKPFFPLSRGKPRVGDRRVLGGNILINSNGLPWRDTPAAFGMPKTLYNRWVRLSGLRVFARILMELVTDEREGDTLMIDATHPKTRRRCCRRRHPRIPAGRPGYDADWLRNALIEHDIQRCILARKCRKISIP